MEFFRWFAWIVVLIVGGSLIGSMVNFSIRKHNVFVYQFLTFCTFLFFCIINYVICLLAMYHGAKLHSGNIVEPDVIGISLLALGVASAFFICKYK